MFSTRSRGQFPPSAVLGMFSSTLDSTMMGLHVPGLDSTLSHSHSIFRSRVHVVIQKAFSTLPVHPSDISSWRKSTIPPPFHLDSFSPVLPRSGTRQRERYQSLISTGNARFGPVSILQQHCSLPLGQYKSRSPNLYSWVVLVRLNSRLLSIDCIGCLVNAAMSKLLSPTTQLGL